MKRILSILFVCVAVVATLSISVVPHHHHDTVACVTNHLCGNGNECGNADEHHEHEAGDTENSGNCVAETEYIDRLEREDKSDCGSAACGHDGHAHLFPTVYLCVSIFSNNTAAEAETDYGEYIIHYHSIHVRTVGGLRAPPTILC